MKKHVVEVTHYNPKTGKGVMVTTNPVEHDDVTFNVGSFIYPRVSATCNVGKRYEADIVKMEDGYRAFNIQERSLILRKG